MAFSKELEEVIEAALADGVITEKERSVIHKKALIEGVNPDEIDVVMDGRLAKMRKNQEDWNLPVNPVHIEKEKHGNIVKCPNCGEPVPGGAAVCPACGHEFRNIEANRTAKAFAEGLKKLKKEQYAGRDLRKQVADMEKEDSFVENFPIPNTSEDLFEIIKLIKPKAKKDNEAYWNLFTRCIDSVNSNFPNDKRFLPFVKYYNAEKKTHRGLIQILSIFAVLAVLIGIIWGLVSVGGKDIDVINDYKTQQIQKISDLESPNEENYNIMRSALISLTYDVKYIGDQGFDDSKQKAEMAAYQSFMEAKQAYAKILNSIYMDAHEGQSDPALEDILQFSPSDVKIRFNVSSLD